MKASHQHAQDQLDVNGSSIHFYSTKSNDYLSLTDIARSKDSVRSDYILQNWMRNRSTIEFIGLWELFYNPDFNSIEFDGIKNMSGSNSFSLTPKRWIETTSAIGIVSKSGRNGGTFAHIDIAFEFATWLSASFKFYLIREYQKLKDEENKRNQIEWSIHRVFAKINYRIHTDAIKTGIIPKLITKLQIQSVYSSEADLLNVALFGKTAREWRDNHPSQQGNIRDEATLEQLLVLANLESLNAEFIRMGFSQSERLTRLNQTAIYQMKALVDNPSIKALTK
jgi:hypothetical protein